MLELEKSYPSVNKTFRIPMNIVEQLEYLAGVNNTSVNKVVVQCLQYALDNLQTDEEEHQRAVRWTALFYCSRSQQP